MTYPGGKNGSGVYQTIINQMPPHDVYIEPFLGGGAIMLRKRPAALNVGLDIDDAAACAIRGRRLPRTNIYTMDAIKFLAAAEPRDWFGFGTLVYCDPPYLISARKHHRPIYRHELTDADHRRLLTVLRGLTCRVMISGYGSDLYSRMLADWRLVTFEATTRGGSMATEHLWCNFPAPLALHDYSFLGADYRQRENIKRKVTRWSRRFAAMPVLERQAIASALAVSESPTARSAGERSSTGASAARIH